MQKPSPRSRRRANITIAVMYTALIAVISIYGDPVFAVLFLLIGLIQNSDTLLAWYRSRRRPAPSTDAGVQ